MTQLPEDEERMLTPYRGGSVLEFGNKKNPSGTYQKWYEQRGCEHYVSIDWNGKDGALPMDCNAPFSISPRNFSVVTNFGFSEHVTNQASFWENHHRHAAVGGIFCGVTPAPGHWPNHGILQPSRDFYFALATLNGYWIVELFVNELRKRHTVCYRMIKPHDREFRWSDDLLALIHHTEEPTQQALRNSGL